MTVRVWGGAPVLSKPSDVGVTVKVHEEFVIVSEKVALPPAAVAVTWNVPETELAVRAGAVADPLASVFTVTVFPEPAKVPL